MAVCSGVKTISSDAFVYITHESWAILLARQKIRICEWIFMLGHRTMQNRRTHNGMEKRYGSRGYTM